MPGLCQFAPASFLSTGCLQLLLNYGRSEKFTQVKEEKKEEFTWDGQWHFKSPRANGRQRADSCEPCSWLLRLFHNMLAVYHNHFNVTSIIPFCAGQNSQSMKKYTTGHLRMLSSSFNESTTTKTRNRSRSTSSSVIVATLLCLCRFFFNARGARTVSPWAKTRRSTVKKEGFRENNFCASLFSEFRCK